VTAAANWDDPAERKRVRPSLEGSVERVFHDVGLARFLLVLRGSKAAQALSEERLERVIGVVYRPESERMSHYVRAKVPEQFDAVLHTDDTAALQPLERWARDELDLPETYPSGM
jgi:erythromycin esterase-like protein